MRWCVFVVVLCGSVGAILGDISQLIAAEASPLTLNLRTRTEVAPGANRWQAITTETTWQADQTAIVVCDMWDKHWCPNATARVAEMAPRMNEVLKAARSKGVLIIHCPSDTMEFYKDTPQRKLAQAAPTVETKRPLEKWCRIDANKEPVLPIDDSDGGCDCETTLKKNTRAWSRQIETLKIHEQDAITDSDEAYRLMKSRGIRNVIVMGVHTNMCVLGRPFAIRQLSYQGMNVALMRDMTDTMYNPAMNPFVSHFTGNDLVVEHIEKYWCPSMTSSDFLGGTPFKFDDDKRPHVVIIAAEDEYKTEVTLPEFARAFLGPSFKTSFVFDSANKDHVKRDLPGIEVVREADVLLISARRRVLPPSQLNLIRKHVADGKPVVGIRTASHAFSFRNAEPPEGFDAWPEIDRDVLGGNYQGHTAGETKGIVWTLPGVGHPILTGISGEFTTGGTLYKTFPLDPAATELMRGRIEGRVQQEPFAWTFQRKDGGRTFYSSMGHPDDFKQPVFQRLLLNGLHWAAGLEVPPADRPLVAVPPGVTSNAEPAPAVSKSWTTATVPGTTKPTDKPSKEPTTGWYYCEVEVPEAWKGRGAFLYVEKLLGASESFVNGTKVGVSGSLPPKYVGGGENQHRYVIPDTILKPGQRNSIAIREVVPEGASGFAGGPPQLIAGGDAIALEGAWAFRSGDDLTWAEPAAQRLTDLKLSPFSKVGKAPEVSKFATVIRREAQQTALSPRESMDHIKCPEDLQIDLVLAEPIVSQPLFMNFDERGRLWVMQYLQYPEPAGLTMLSKDQWWRAVYDKVPEPPPHGVKGIDKISIHEDTDGDGVFDKHTTFLDDLNIATAFVQGRGGVWVLNPPYLLFYPDRDGNDVPDSDPEVHLSGFGIEDSHSVVNSLRWGPDGWLYGAQGSTVSGAVTIGPPRKRDDKTGAPAVHSQGQNVWRYQPTTKRYEIFSEGGGNAFGLELDSAGRAFSGHNGGNTRGFHYQQGAYLQKGFSKHGPLSNPYSFGYFPAMEHHNVPRFTHEFVIYEGNVDGPFALPAKYRGKLFGAAAILNHVVISDVEAVGSTFKTKDIGYAMDSSDSWFRPVDVKDGPDGALYVADWYDGQLAHTANYQGGLDREHGRVYRIRRKPAATEKISKPKSVAKTLDQMTTSELLTVLESPDRWHREAARRLIADRKDAAVVPDLRSKLFRTSGQLSLELLWALNLSDGLNDATALKALEHQEAQVRLWTIRLLADERQLPSDIAARVAAIAVTEPNIEVRNQMAASAKRLPSEQALPILRNLMRHDEDTSEARQPLMIWWALEANVDPPVTKPIAGTTTVVSTAPGEASPALHLFEDRTIWTWPLVQKEILPRLMRRFASTGQRADLAICARLLKQSPNADTTKALMQGFEEAYQGRSLSNVPADLVSALSAAGGGSLSLKIRQGDGPAIDEALMVIADEKAAAGKRAEYAGIFGEVKQPRSVPILLETFSRTADDGLKAAILTSLQAYPDPNIAAAVLNQYANMNEDVRTVAQSLLVSRKSWAIALVEAVDRGEIAATALPLDTVRRLTIHRDDHLAGLIQKHWNQIEGATTAEMQTQIDHYSSVLVGAGDPYPGKKLYLQMCGKCHTLHASGGKIGPDLTTYKRDDLRQMLIHIVNPSAEIREGFETQIAVLKDGRVVTGFLVENDPQTVTLRSPDGQTISLERAELEELIKSRKSLMPENQLKDLSDEQVRNLFAYLRISQPLND
ncbi:PVC-type heme-binding CxxCH protein [Schlesneria paludicola]|uniref:PVC-type heme-binding CxxCH protein n=1 Tax=Schlesneria paludicola TaxID=360056 RepID=UPI00029A0AAF|nr:PVC-type heme-binding CxxCH protein [Schlesneria paludicola]